ncbi:MAG: dehydrogenase E1 component subunit alpha/beta [Rhodothermales bacterium]|nr:dehydrogenase E1 component subunit alpha/beta [Rhodothermales bacterium]MBO6781297.1 dehydrogenase E1 component subunit alpha/beta [Rhodothermales bacterium]
MATKTARRATLDPSDTEALYRALALPRAVEQKMLRLIRQNRLAKWFSGFGQEAIAVGCAAALREDDYLLPMHRNLGMWTTRGVPLEPLFCQLMGREGGFTNGRDRTFHFGLPDHRIVGMISHLAAMLPVACGLGLGARMQGEDAVALALVGEGATREGDFHEALNLAATWDLPVLFVIENNGYGLSTPTSQAMRVVDLADAASGYAMPGVSVDGNDLVAVMEAVSEAADRARRGDGPTLLEMKTFRVRGHEEASGVKYVPSELIAEWETKDPVARFGEHLSPERRAEIDREAEERVEAVAEWALTQPEVTGTRDVERAALFAAGGHRPGRAATESRELRFIDAVSEALREAMREDDSVLLMGQDVADYGGVFKVTAGFLEEFGTDRVRNTPIIESGAVGACMGLALTGLRPVLEIQYADFISCGFNQIVNNLATTHYRWGGALPVTIRAPYGGQIGAGPFHSQSMEAWFCHTPGLKVVIPSTPAEAKGLLLASIDEPNPVLFFEHKLLYRMKRGAVPDGSERIALGTAGVVRPGSAATIVSWGLGVDWALEAADGLDVEVIDLRTLIPWDRETVLESVRKTGRLLVVHEAPRTAGFGAEIAAEITEEAFTWLDAPPMRVAAEDLPIPFAAALERDVHSARPRVAAALQRLLSF